MECTPKHTDTVLQPLQVCSLTRSTIADRCGVRVGHQIIEINGRSVVDSPHEDIVQALTTIIGDVSGPGTVSMSMTLIPFPLAHLFPFQIHVKTMPDPLFRVMTGKIAPKFT